MTYHWNVDADHIKKLWAGWNTVTRTVTLITLTFAAKMVARNHIT